MKSNDVRDVLVLEQFSRPYTAPGFSTAPLVAARIPLCDMAVSSCSQLPRPSPPLLLRCCRKALPPLYHNTLLRDVMAKTHKVWPLGTCVGRNTPSAGWHCRWLWTWPVDIYLGEHSLFNIRHVLPKYHRWRLRTSHPACST